MLFLEFFPCAAGGCLRALSFEEELRKAVMAGFNHRWSAVLQCSAFSQAVKELPGHGTLQAIE
jgi:hypothetical protein